MAGRLRWLIAFLLLKAALGFPASSVEPARQAAHPHVAPSVDTRERSVGRDGAPLILIPSGGYVMGSESGQEDERPPHPVELDAFYIDRHEVTVSRYARFLQAERPDTPFLWTQAISGGHGDKPVIGVSWYEAQEYCTWAGRRLPTEAEWEKAARSADQRIYPWGNGSPTKTHTNAGQTKWAGYQTLGVVGSRPRGSSPYGVDDLSGNVWEWIADRYDAGYYAHSPVSNPTGPDTGPLRVLRGGAWNNDAAAIRSANRAAYIPTARRNDVGFRCAMNVVSQP